MPTFVWYLGALPHENQPQGTFRTPEPREIAAHLGTRQKIPELYFSKNLEILRSRRNFLPGKKHSRVKNCPVGTDSLPR